MASKGSEILTTDISDFQTVTKHDEIIRDNIDTNYFVINEEYHEGITPLVLHDYDATEVSVSHGHLTPSSISYTVSTSSQPISFTVIPDTDYYLEDVSVSGYSGSISVTRTSTSITIEISAKTYGDMAVTPKFKQTNIIGSDGNVYYYTTSGSTKNLTGVEITNPALVVPNQFSEIPSEVFNENTIMTTLTLPTSVTTIRSYAFNRCTNLTSVTFNETSAITIESKGFNECGSLTTLDFLSMGSNFKSCTFGDGTYSSQVWNECSLRYIKVTKDNFTNGQLEYYNWYTNGLGSAETVRQFFAVRCPGYAYMTGEMANHSGDKKDYLLENYRYSGSTHEKMRTIYDAYIHAWKTDTIDEYIYSNIDGDNTPTGSGTKVGCGSLGVMVFRAWDHNGSQASAHAKAKLNVHVYVYGLGTLSDSQYTAAVVNRGYAFTGCCMRDISTWAADYYPKAQSDMSYMHAWTYNDNNTDSEDLARKWCNWQGYDRTYYVNMNDYCYPAYLDQWLPI